MLKHLNSVLLMHGYDAHDSFLQHSKDEDVPIPVRMDELGIDQVPIIDDYFVVSREI